MNFFRAMFLLLSVFLSMMINLLTEFGDSIDPFKSITGMLIVGGFWVECLVILCGQSLVKFRK